MIVELKKAVWNEACVQEAELIRDHKDTKFCAKNIFLAKADVIKLV